MNNAVEYHVQGERLQLLPDRAIYWPARQTLLVSDPHFGKASAFRDAGVPVPTGTTANDLARLTTLLELTSARELIILGDFFHHKSGQCARTMSLMAKWRAQFHNLNLQVILGNHDRHSHLPPEDWGVMVHDKPLPCGPFLLCHEPCQHDSLYVLSGHIHPAVRLTDASGHGLTVTCFYFAPGCGILPAFGSFTGTAPVKLAPGNVIFAIADGQVIPLPRR